MMRKPDTRDKGACLERPLSLGQGFGNQGSSKALAGCDRRVQPFTSSLVAMAKAQNDKGKWQAWVAVLIAVGMAATIAIAVIETYWG